MINVVNFSGGRTSAYMVHLMRQHDPEAHYIFLDTGAEHPKTYDFIRDVVRHWDIPLVCLRLRADTPLGQGNNYDIVPVDDIQCDLKPWQEMLRKYGTPNPATPICTSRMKTLVAKAYCRDMFGKDYCSWLGMRRDEPQRIFGKSLSAKLRPYGLDIVLDACYEDIPLKVPEHLMVQAVQQVTNKYDKQTGHLRYLAQLSDADKQDILAWWREQPFDLQIPEHMGNCVFCVKKGANKLALAAKDDPELAKQFTNMVYTSPIRVRPQVAHIPPDRMYRNRQSLISIMHLYADQSAEEIRSKLKYTKDTKDTSTCSESCEAFSEDNT